MTLAEERLEFKVAVLALDGGCVAARDGSPCEGALQAHHAITQAQLRRAGLSGDAWDPRAGASVCERHHRRHHSRREPIPYGRLPRRCVEFAEERGLAYLIDRYYPKETA